LLKLKWTTDYIARQNWAKYRTLQAQQHFAVLQYGIDDNQFTHHWEGATALNSKILKDLLPWIDVAPEDPEAIAARMTAAYEEAFGSPDDPEYDAEVDALIEHWRGTEAA
jgi:hypothetical protein